MEGSGYKGGFNKFLSIILLLGICFTFVNILYATAPNPGHDFTSASGGVVQGDVLYGSAADTLSALAKNASATRYIANTGTSNNPAWAQIDLTNGVTGILTSVNGGTGNGFTKFSGPATSEKTFTLPDASATVLTSNAAVTVAQGGTGAATLGDAGVLIGNATGAVQVTSAGTSGQVLTSNGAGVDPTFQTAAGGDDGRIIFDALTTGEQFDTTANSTSMTEATNLSQTLAAGTYVFRYNIIYRTNDAADGIRFGVNFTGTSGAFVWHWYVVNTVATASNAAADQNSVLSTATLPGYYAARVKATSGVGTTVSADTVNADVQAIIEGVFVATGSGDLELWAGNEAAGTGDFNSLMIGTSVMIFKTK